MMSYKLKARKPSCSDTGHDSTCTADEYDSMGSTGDGRKRRMRGGVKREAGQKDEVAVVPLQRPMKKTRGRVKLDIEYIDNLLRRRKIFCTRKDGAMKQVKELAKLTGSQVLLLVASETGHVYKCASNKLQPMFTSEVVNALIQSCLNSPQDSPPHIDDDDDDYLDDDDDAPMDLSATAAPGFKEKMDLTFQASEDESLLGSTKSKPENCPVNNIMASLPGTATTTSAQSNVVPTTTSVIVHRRPLYGIRRRLEIQQRSQAPTTSSIMPMEGHVTYHSPPQSQTPVMYDISQGPFDLQLSHEEVVE